MGRRVDKKGPKEQKQTPQNRSVCALSDGAFGSLRDSGSGSVDLQFSSW